MERILEMKRTVREQVARYGGVSSTIPATGSRRAGGNCRRLMRSRPDASVDLIVNIENTSPPTPRLGRSTDD